MNRYDPTDSMEEVRHGSYVLFEEAQKRIAELEKIIDFDTERFRELGEEIQELKKRIAEQEAWVSVNKRLPPKDERRINYLCTDGHTRFVTEYREYRDRWCFDTFSGQPTHWMELPNIPREGGADEKRSKK